MAKRTTTEARQRRVMCFENILTKSLRDREKGFANSPIKWMKIKRISAKRFSGARYGVVFQNLMGNRKCEK